jgi:hypothetical protein
MGSPGEIARSNESLTGRALRPWFGELAEEQIH